MKDNKSKYLNLPLPDPINPLEFDVHRIIESFSIIEEHTKETFDKTKKNTDEAFFKLNQDIEQKFSGQDTKIDNLIKVIKELKTQLDIQTNDTKDQFLKVFPKKSILLFSGSLNEIPNGWAICDGKNGTPDLTNKFILGAGKNTNVGATGGSLNHKHSISGTVHNHTLTEGQMPHHGHNLSYGGHHLSGGPSFLHLSPGGPQIMMGYGTGGNQAHSHGFNAAASDEANVPPYYALAYIMKL